MQHISHSVTHTAPRSVPRRFDQAMADLNTAGVRQPPYFAAIAKALQQTRGQQGHANELCSSCREWRASVHRTKLALMPFQASVTRSARKCCQPCMKNSNFLLTTGYKAQRLILSILGTLIWEPPAIRSSTLQQANMSRARGRAGICELNMWI